MKQLRKELREEVDKLEEEKDEVQRLLAKLRTTKRQLERDVDSLQVICHILQCFSFFKKCPISIYLIFEFPRIH
jgi:transposase